MVTFLPEEKGKLSAQGTFGPDGNYQLKSSGGITGAVVGKYTVIVQATETTEDSGPTSLIPPRYADPDQSGLSLEVKPGDQNLPIALTR